MISQEEMLNIICTEAIEYGGLQEIPTQKDGATNSFHSRKRGARAPSEARREEGEMDVPLLAYNLRLVQKTDGTFEWKD
jgi:hypothetical protein